MALSKDDLEKISNIIEAGNDFLDVKWVKRFSVIEQKLYDHDKHFDSIKKKLDQIIKTENEDILAFFKDLHNVKTRLKKAGV